jgi:single-stranded-DNA-specific exonuclease
VVRIGCGAGVAFKFAQALLARTGCDAERLHRISKSFLKMVAIATVADVVPLSGENRVMVKHGLEGLRDIRNPGLRALFEAAGFAPEATPTARQVAFQIGPRINAAGRMDTAEAAIELFLTSDAGRARELAGQLDEQNAERQRVEAEIRETCQAAPADPAAAALVYYDPEWHRGVLGIVASRLVERFHRPVFVLGLDEDGLAQGSGRSIPGFHLLEALESMHGLFSRFGGHRYAAGVTLEPARIEEFRERLNAYAAERLGPEDFTPRLSIDAVLDLSEACEAATRDLAALGPFGYGNPQPVFAALDVEVAAPPAVWSQKHLRVTVRRNGCALALKAWNFGERIADFAPGSRVDVAFTLEEDPRSAARGCPGWSAVLRDARPAAQAASA